MCTGSGRASLACGRVKFDPVRALPINLERERTPLSYRRRNATEAPERTLLRAITRILPPRSALRQLNNRRAVRYSPINSDVVMGIQLEIGGDSLDDVLIELYKALLATNGRNEGGTRGPTKELLGVTLRIENPRARLSRSEDRGKPFSALGELLWYLSGSDRLDFIEPYVPRYKEDAVDGVLPGAYGPRLLAKGGSINQIANITNLLRAKPGSRRAVI